MDSSPAAEVVIIVLFCFSDFSVSVFLAGFD